MILLPHQRRRVARIEFGARIQAHRMELQSGDDLAEMRGRAVARLTAMPLHLQVLSLAHSQRVEAA